MKKSWTEIKSEIEQEIDVIWYEEPREVKASNRGCFRVELVPRVWQLAT